MPPLRLSLPLLPWAPTPLPCPPLPLFPRLVQTLFLMGLCLGVRGMGLVKGLGEACADRGAACTSQGPSLEVAGGRRGAALVRSVHQSTAKGQEDGTRLGQMNTRGSRTGEGVKCGKRKGAVMLPLSLS